MAYTRDQSKFIDHPKGRNALVIAGAGSGKSHTSIGFLKKQVELGVAANRIVAVMFGHDAANQFLDRLKRAMPDRTVIPDSKTFHSLCSYYILSPLTRKGIIKPMKFERYESKMIRLLKQIVDRAPINEKSRWGAVFKMQSYIDFKKSTLTLPHDEILRRLEIKNDYAGYFPKLFEQYESAREEAGLRFNSDLIYDAVSILKKSQQARDYVRELFDIVLVDEYQDICEAQQEIVRYLKGDNTAIIAVGDDDQCIYTWRGADPSYITSKFKTDFKNVDTYFLSQTFRYGSRIALAAHNCISNNKNRIDKISVSSNSAPSTEIHVEMDNNSRSSLLKHIAQWEESGRNLTEVAILVRAFGHAAILELALLEAGKPYQVIGGSRLLADPAVRSLLAGVQIASRNYKTMTDQQKSKVCEEFIGYPELPIGSDSRRRVMDIVRKDCDSIISALNMAANEAHTSTAKELTFKKIDCWHKLNSITETDPSELINIVADTLGIENEIRFYSKNPTDDVDRWREIQNAFESFAKSSGKDAPDFAKFIHSMIENDESPHESDDSAPEHKGVVITSVHRSKGLEYPLVIIPKLVSGSFPLLRRGQTPTVAWLEDERRLFYVAITRAQEKLVLLVPHDPILAQAINDGNDTEPEGGSLASSFVYEMNAGLSSRIYTILSGDVSALEKASSKDKTVKFIQKMAEQGLIK